MTDLEIYSAYLPYEVKGQLQWNKEEDFIHEDWVENLSIFEKGSKWTLCGYADEDLNIPLGEGEFSGWLWRNDMTYVCFHNNAIKPILRPLSDLINDEKTFVEIFTKATGINYYTKEVDDIFDIRTTNSNYYLCTELNRKISTSYCSDTRVFRVFDKNGNNVQIKSQLELFHILLKNHYDIFRWIKQGKAININTL